MTHFVGLVFGSNIEGQLAKFEEKPGNRNRQWDWYKIGGRWEGLLPSRQGNVNQARFKDIDWEKFIALDIPSVVVMDGKWYSKYKKFGFWGMAFEKSGKVVGPFDRGASDKTEKAWELYFMDLLRRVGPNTLVTVVDFHI